MGEHNCENCNVLFKSFFSILAKDDLHDLTEKKKCIFYKKKQTVFTDGTRPSGIYCIKKGKIIIYKTGTYGKEQIIGFALPGDLLGLRSFFCDRNYTSSSVAIEDSLLCFITKQDFLFLLDKYPQITNSIIGLLSELLDEANIKVTSLAQKPVRERLAETLVTLNNVYKPDPVNSEEPNTVISLSRQDLANLVGTATETAIRLLSEFKRDNLIEINGKKITILDLINLQKIANL
ncbi:MAG: Crp/Fnr family transcriptional regulator [Bacteroidota bacterium]